MACEKGCQQQKLTSYHTSNQRLQSSCLHDLLWQCGTVGHICGHLGHTVKDLRQEASASDTCSREVSTDLTSSRVAELSRGYNTCNHVASGITWYHKRVHWRQLPRLLSLPSLPSPRPLRWWLAHPPCRLPSRVLRWHGGW